MGGFVASVEVAIASTTYILYGNGRLRELLFMRESGIYMYEVYSKELVRWLTWNYQVSIYSERMVHAQG